MIKIQEQKNKPKEELMQELNKEIYSCRKCQLWKTRNKPMVGDGPINAKILVIGESPGYNEDLQGKAFVGEAGKILDQLLSLINLTRNNIYITNILKCHPPKNHNPTRQEIESCIGYLHRQINILKPKIILTLGKYASKEIFNKFNLEFIKISEHHAKIFDVETSFGDTIIIPMYHPSVACYHDKMLNILKKDFIKVREIIPVCF